MTEIKNQYGPNEADLQTPIESLGYADALAMLRRVQNLPKREDVLAFERKLVSRIAQLGNSGVQPEAKILGARHAANMETIRRHPGISVAIGNLKAKMQSLAQLQTTLKEAGMMPGSAKALIEKLESQIGSSTSITEVTELSARKSRLREIVDVVIDSQGRTHITENPNVTASAVRQVNLAIADIVPDVKVLELVIEMELNDQENALKQQETDFFACYGMPWEATQVSKSVRTTREHIASIMGGFHRAVAVQAKGAPGNPVGLHMSQFDELFN